MVTYYFCISRQTHYMAKFYFSCYGPKCYRSVKLLDSLKCNMSRKNSGIKLIICVDIKVKVFFEMFFFVVVYLFVCFLFVFSFFLLFDGCGYLCPNYPKYQVCHPFFALSQEKGEGKLWFFAWRYTSKFSTQADMIVFDAHNQVWPKYSKLKFCKIFAVSQGKKEVDFLHVDKHQTFLQFCQSCPEYPK